MDVNFAKTNVRATTLRWKLQIKLASSPSHGILIRGDVAISTGEWCEVVGLVVLAAIHQHIWLMVHLLTVQPIKSKLK